MAINFIAQQDLQNYVAAVLKRVGVEVVTDINLSTFWPAIVQQSWMSAANEIFDRLIRRGWTSSQIQGWDRGAESQMMIGVYFALRDGAFLDKFDKTFIDELKRYFDDTNPNVKSILELTLVTNNAQWQIPGDTPGNLQEQPINTSQDMFVMPTQQQDPRIGQTVRW